MTQAAKHVLAVKSLLPFDTLTADPCCTSVAVWLVRTLCEMLRPYQTVAGDGHARALDLILLFSGDNDFHAAIGAGSFAAKLQSMRETASCIESTVKQPKWTTALPQVTEITTLPVCT